MFSDFKSRGFGLTQSQLRSPGKLSCLILIMAFALYWAVSTGLWAVKNPVYKKTAEKSALRSMVSLFKAGLRTLKMRVINEAQNPKFVGNMVKLGLW